MCIRDSYLVVRFPNLAAKFTLRYINTIPSFTIKLSWHFQTLFINYKNIPSLTHVLASQASRCITPLYPVRTISHGGSTESAVPQNIIADRASFLRGDKQVVDIRAFSVMFAARSNPDSWSRIYRGILSLLREIL